MPILPIYAEDLGATSTLIGLMVAGFSVSRGLLQPVVGGWSDRRGRKRFLATGLAIYAVAGLLYVVAGSVLDLILIRIGHGVGSAMIVPIAMSYVGDLAPEGEEGRYMGIFNIALFAGIGSGPVIGGLFLDGFGAESAFIAMSSLAALALLLVGVVLPSDSGRADGARPPLRHTLRRMAGDRRVLGILLPRMATMVVMVPTMAFLPLLMEGFMDATGVQIGAVIAARTLTNAVLQTPFGRLADRHDRGRLIVVGSGVVAAALFVVSVVESFGLLLVVFVVMGAGEALVWPALGALAATEGRTYGQGSMMGVFNMAMSAGVFVGSLGAGSVADAFGLEWAFVAVGVVVAVSAVVGERLLASRPEPARAGAHTPVDDRDAGPVASDA